jgi:hypothetical protein
MGYIIHTAEQKRVGGMKNEKQNNLSRNVYYWNS